MDEITRRSVIVYDRPESLAQAVATGIVGLAQMATKGRGRFDLVLSGGSTPEPVFELLASEPYVSAFPWDETHFYWADERCVPPDSEGSNYGQARRMMLATAPIRAEHIHRIRGELPAEAAADEYANRLALQADEGREWPLFDLVLLGLGSDGHTASLFPEQIDRLDLSKPAVAVTAHYADRPSSRVSLTPPVLSSARQIFFLVTGSDKAEAVRAVLSVESAQKRWPASLIRPESGWVSWQLDSAAAASWLASAMRG